MAPTLLTSTAPHTVVAVGVDSGQRKNLSRFLSFVSVKCSFYAFSCSDGGLDGVFELHVEDGCGLMSNGSINDISLSLPANTPFMCEIDLQCPGRWIRYVDDGSEGHDSCLTVGLSPYTQFNGLLSYPGNFGSWLSAVNSAPPGSHLITVRSSSHSFALNSAIAAAAAGSGTVAYLAWTGAVQSVNAADFGTGWSWMDGTPSANLNCDNTGTAAGCDLWYPQYPTNRYGDAAETCTPFLNA